MTRTTKAKELCNELRQLWLEGTESEREAISADISALTQRPAFSTLSERVLAEMRGDDG